MAALLVASGGAFAIARGAHANEPPVPEAKPPGVEQAVAKCVQKAAEVEDDDPDAVLTRCLGDAVRALLERYGVSIAMLNRFRIATQEFCWTRIMGAHVRMTGDDGSPACALHPEREYTPSEDDYRWVSRCTAEQHRTLLAAVLKHGIGDGELADRLLPPPSGATKGARERLASELSAIDDCQPDAKKRLALYRVGTVEVCKLMTRSKDEDDAAVEACTADIGERSAAAWLAR